MSLGDCSRTHFRGRESPHYELVLEVELPVHLYGIGHSGIWSNSYRNFSLELMHKIIVICI